MLRPFVRILLAAGLLLGLASLGTGASPATTEQLASDDIDPFPLGVCLRVEKADPKPLCVLIDPDDDPVLGRS